MMSRRAGVVGVVLFCSVMGVVESASAEDRWMTVREPLPSRIDASAEFFKGAKYPVVIIHGFLSTNQYPTMGILKDTFAARGHTVVAPMLSLGIHQRKESLSCEAANVHDMEMGVREIAFWVNWAKKKTGRQPALVGHSFGATMALAYLDQVPNAYRNVRYYQGVSLVSTEYYSVRGHTHAAMKKARADQDASDLREYPLSYCKSYKTTPKAFLSYAAWDYPKITAALKRLSDVLPVYAVMGGADDRLPPTWIDELSKIDKVSVKKIDGANHFFAGAQEFALMEEIEVILDEKK